ncbi:MAG: DUF503 domain-containing protein [Gemmatimonadota bacterium]|nr:DUF503 domain-containing protein [Gemmatimonadota bacterium]
MPAVYARARWVLRLPGCRSLKEKRRLVRGLRDRVRARFAVSVAETDFQEEHGRAELSVALVTSEAALADSILTRLDTLVAADPRWFVIEREAEVQ